MAKGMKITVILAVVATLGFCVLQALFPSAVWLALAITSAVTAYHFGMRLFVGFLINAIFHNRMDYEKSFFRVRAWEMQLYEKWKVKRWKGKMPTYSPDTFDPKKRTWHEIAQASCQAEVVHEIIVLLSFLPIVCGIWFGDWWVFIATSILSACIDGAFVLIQRYNRPRLLKMVSRQEKDETE